MWIAGFPGATIEDVRFANCTFRGVTATEVVSGAGSILLHNVTFEPAKKARSLNSVAPAPGTTPLPQRATAHR